MSEFREMTPDDAGSATERARVLAQALPFLRRYAGATIVVKYGGHAMGEDDLAVQFGSDIALLKQVGVNPVVVHGGGPQINAMLKRRLNEHIDMQANAYNLANRYYYDELHPAHIVLGPGRSALVGLNFRF